MSLVDPALREICVDFAKTIADELERPDQDYIGIVDFSCSVQLTLRRSAREMIERYVRRAVEADRKARACPAAE